jgi:protocatechuate 3,4-dioxygenase beta subunit
MKRRTVVAWLASACLGVGLAAAVAVAQTGTAAPGRASGEQAKAGSVGASAAVAASAASGGASAVLVPDGEAGEPLLVDGRVLSSAGGAPVAGAALTLYQTDHTGCYSKGCSDERNPGARSARLRGTLRTDAQGRYQFRTIKPGQYPGSGPPAHIHYELTIGQQPMVPLELIFEGDSRLTPDIRARAARHDFFILCAPAKDADRTLRCRGADVVLK